MTTGPSSPWQGSSAALDMMSGLLDTVAAPMDSLSGTLANLSDRAADLGAGVGVLKLISAGLALPAEVGNVRDAWRDTASGRSRMASSFAASSDLLQSLSTITGAAALAAVPLPPVQIALAATAATLAFAGGIASVMASVRDSQVNEEPSTMDGASGRGGRRASSGPAPASRRGPSVGGAAANSLRGLRQTVDDLVLALRQGRQNIEHLAIHELRPARASLDSALQGSSTPIHRQTSTALDGASTALQRTAQSLTAAEAALQSYRAAL